MKYSIFSNLSTFFSNKIRAFSLITIHSIKGKGNISKVAMEAVHMVLINTKKKPVKASELNTVKKSCRLGGKIFHLRFSYFSSSFDL